MLNFKPLELEDRDLFLRYLGNYEFNTYEYSFLSLYLWKDYCQVEYGILEDELIIKKTEDKRGSYFMQPIGYAEEALPEIIEVLIKAKQEDPSFKCLFRDIEEPFLGKLQELYGPKVKYFEETPVFDYLYETQKFIHLSGEKLSKRKNQVHQFLHEYNYELKDIHHPGVKEDCYQFSKEWLKNKEVKHRELIYELEGIKNVLDHLDHLPAIGMAVYVNDRIAGYTLGEKVNRDMAIIHVEKGNTQYKGIYAFINKTFAEKYLSETAVINREEDLGLACLKKAKEACDPLRLEKKFRVNIQ